MKKNLVLITIFLLAVTIAGAQRDTIYLNSWFKPAEKGEHSYYRVIDTLGSGKYEIRDFYNNGVLQMKGCSDAPDAKHLTGKVFRYNTDGGLATICKHKQYNEGWQIYYDTNSKKFAAVWCKDDVKDGKAYFYNKKGKRICKASYKNDRRWEGLMPVLIGNNYIGEYHFIRYKEGKAINEYKYYSKGKMAMKSKITYDKHTQKIAEYFDENGKKIGTCTYSNDMPQNGIDVEFFDDSYYLNRPVKIKSISKFRDTFRDSQTFFDGNGKQIGTCIFQNGYPYEGKILHENKLETFSDGKTLGETVVYSNDLKKVLYSYQVKAGEKQGPTTYYYPASDSVATGYYKDDRPWEGLVFVDNKLCAYQEGKLHGECRIYDDDGKPYWMVTYQNGQKEGPCMYSFRNKLGVITGTYHNNALFSGYFSEGGQQTKISFYENGVKIHSKTYDTHSLLLISEESFADSTVIYYTADGSILFSGKKRRNQPFEGTFLIKGCEVPYANGKVNGIKKIYNDDKQLIRTESWLNDTLHGETVYYKDAEIQCKAFFIKGKPFDGTVINKNGTSSYQNGQQEGVSTWHEKGFFCSCNFRNNQKDGEIICQAQKSAFPKGDSLLEDVAEVNKNYYILRGFYKEGKRDEGTFLLDYSVAQFKNGEKAGKELSFLNVPTSPVIALETFSNGLLDGPAKYFLDGTPFQSVWSAGKIVEGPEIDRNNLHKIAHNRIRIYTNGAYSGTYIEYAPQRLLIVAKGVGEELSGYRCMNVNRNFMEIFEDGKMVKILHLNMSDTIDVTLIQGDSGITYNKQREVIARSKFESYNYNSGKTVYYDKGIAVNTVEFKNHSLTKGCFEKNRKEDSNIRNLESIRVCQGDSTTITLRYYKSRLGSVTVFKRPLEMDWPMELSWEWVREIKAKSGGITRYIDLKNNDLIAAFKSDANIRVDPNGDEYQISRITKEGGYEKFDLSFEALVEKLKSWQQ